MWGSKPRIKNEIEEQIGDAFASVPLGFLRKTILFFAEMCVKKLVPLLNPGNQL